MASDDRRPIPRIIHQTWKDRSIPPQWAGFHASWREHHPDWEHRLWTDADLRDLIRRDYPWFLPVFDGYRGHIKRVDAARYFMLHRFGGLYVDLDFEALGPIDELLAGQEVVFGLEPPAHANKGWVRDRGIDAIVCNAFCASTAGHPFWEHAFRKLVASHWEPDTLDATGPFFLTRALRTYPERSRVLVTPASWLYPITFDEARGGLLEDPAERARVEAEAFAIHHWSGTWWRTPSDDERARLRLRPARFVLAERGVSKLVATFDPDSTPESVVGAGVTTLAARPASALSPLLSCLLVATDADVGPAIRAFQAQTYAAKELVVIDASSNSGLGAQIAALADPQIVHVRAPLGQSLRDLRGLPGLRELARAHARGAFACGWDADSDTHAHRRRLEVQMALVAALDADACVLSRATLIAPDERRVASSERRVDDRTMVFANGPEDASARVITLDAPELQVRVFRGVASRASLGEAWDRASERWDGIDFADRLRAVLVTLPHDAADALAAELALVPTPTARAPAPPPPVPRNLGALAGRVRWMLGTPRRAFEPLLGELTKLVKERRPLKHLFPRVPADLPTEPKSEPPATPAKP